MSPEMQQLVGEVGRQFVESEFNLPFLPEELYSLVHTAQKVDNLPKHKKLLYSYSPEQEFYYVVNGFNRLQIEFVYGLYERKDAGKGDRGVIVYHHPALDYAVASKLAQNLAVGCLGRCTSLTFMRRQPENGLSLVRSILESAVQGQPTVVSIVDGVEAEVATITELRELFNRCTGVAPLANSQFRISI